MKNDSNIASLITNYDPVSPGKYKVVYGIGKVLRTTALLTTTILATNRYDAIKKLKAENPMFCCVECEKEEA